MYLDEADFLEMNPREIIGFGWVKWTFSFMILDIVCYGIIMPVLAVYFAGIISSKTFACLDTLVVEFFLTIIFTVALVYLAFILCGEPYFWRHLFAFEADASRLLQIRDVMNVCMIVGTLVCLLKTIVLMAIVDKGIKTVSPVGEGLFFFILKKLGSKSLLESFGYHKSQNTMKIMNSVGETEMLERGGAFMLFWAMLAACIVKVLYFNTLFTYLRSMEIFMSLKPTFEDDDEYEDADEDSILSRSTLYRNKSRMDGDVARALKVQASSSRH